MLRANSPEALQEIVLRLCTELGGTPVDPDDPDALPLDLSVVGDEPILVVAADPQARQLLSRLLPNAVADARNSAARMQSNERLAETAAIDHLTGLWNRRFTELAIHRAIHGDCLVILDIDHFKSVNDTHGHEAGDAVLIAFARHLNREFPAPAVAGRLGGEEFILLLPRTTPGAAQAALQGFRDIWLEAAPMRVTFSAGVAAVDPQGTNALGAVQSALRAADQSLYRAKNLGRDRIEIAGQNRQEDADA